MSNSRRARHHGFDGWFVNQETAGGDTRADHGNEGILNVLARQRAAGGLVRRDDQDRQCEPADRVDQRFFRDGSTRVSDEVVLNFWWSSSGLASSAALARSLSRPL